MRSIAFTSLVVASVATRALSAQSTPAEPPRTSVDARPTERRITVGGTTFSMRPSNDGFLEATMTAPAARLFEVLQQSYEDVGLKPKELDQNLQQVGTGTFRAQYRIGKQRMSSLVDCGMDGMGLKQADSYALTMRVTTQILPEAADRSTIRTIIQTSGRPQSNSGNELHCPSLGVLEQKIAEAVAARAAKP